VRDKHTGQEHIVGFDRHDSLIKGDNGSLMYRNMQNGDGSDDGYEFIFDEDEFGAFIEMVNIEEAVEMWRKAERLRKENEAALKKMLGDNVVIMS
jgi:hypothetical protein